MESADRLRRLSSRLIANDRVFLGFQRGLEVSDRARRKLDRNLLRLLSALNLPAYADVARIDEQVALLEEDVARLAGRLAVLRARLEARADAEERRTRAEDHGPGPTTA